MARATNFNPEALAIIRMDKMRGKGPMNGYRNDIQTGSKGGLVIGVMMPQAFCQ